MTSGAKNQPKFDKLLEYINVNPQQQPNYKCEVNNKKISVGKGNGGDGYSPVINSILY